MLLDSPAAKALELVGPEGKPTTGLVSVQRPIVDDLSVDEHVAVLNAQFIKGIDFIFLRRFSDERSVHVAAYIVDNTENKRSPEDLAKLHKQVWLSGASPLLYVVSEGRVDVLSCARDPDFWHQNRYQYSPARTVEIIHESRQITEKMAELSVLRLADGTFWEAKNNRELVNYSKAAHQSLIQAILETDQELKGESNPTERRLLLLMIMIKYLEDRRVFPGEGWFGRFRKGARNFQDILRGENPSEVYMLLSSLERRFNGEVFTLHGEERLTKKNLALFAELVEAKRLGSQYYLWEQFSFEHLPVEVISNVYQHFVKGGHGTVYTPPMLANLLIDFAMPYAKLDGREKVLDPACGSGVFLVGAFRRLVNVWRMNNSWKRPSVDVLKRILRDQIFGIEMDRNAVQLTSFSLCLAVCDALQPDVIWKSLKFDSLKRTNFIKGDFFDILKDERSNDDGYSIIIGNPPFESELSSSAKLVEERQRKKSKRRGSLPDNQTAYLFLEQAFSLLHPNGRICMIQPSGLLYNKNTESFRTNLFMNRKIDSVFDFTSIRSLYDQADPKTVALLASREEPTEDHFINHLTFRRTLSVHEKLCFEIDYYDRHQVGLGAALTDRFVWRINLLGGGRLHSISERFRSMTTLREFLQVKKEWDYGEGFIAAKTGKRVRADFLVGKPLLPADALTDEGIDESRITKVTERYFRSAYDEKRYDPPLILIKETSSLPMVYWDNGFIAYNSNIVGIHAPRSDEVELRNVYNTIRANHSVYQFACVLHGSRNLVGKATSILKQDLDLLPFPQSAKELDLSNWEGVLKDDALEYVCDFIRLGQNSLVLNLKCDENILSRYSDVFKDLLSTAYPNLKASTPLFLNGLVCQSFYFGDHAEVNWLSETAGDDLRRIVYNENHSHLRTVRVLRLYLQNVLLVVKPNLLRYWIRSTAIRDADDTLKDLHGWGY